MFCYNSDQNEWRTFLVLTRQIAIVFFNSCVYSLHGVCFFYNQYSIHIPPVLSISMRDGEKKKGSIKFCPTTDSCINLLVVRNAGKAASSQFYEWLLHFFHLFHPLSFCKRWNIVQAKVSVTQAFTFILTGSVILFAPWL